jgi:uncharacterized protein YggE
MTVVDATPDFATLRTQVEKLSRQADATLVQIDRLNTVCSALADVREVQQDMRQALLLILNYLDAVAPQ